MNLFEKGALILSGIVFTVITLTFAWCIIDELWAERRFLKRERKRWELKR